MGAVAASTFFEICLSVVRATNLLRMLPTTISLTPPSRLLRAQPPQPDGFQDFVWHIALRQQGTDLDEQLGVRFAPEKREQIVRRYARSPGAAPRLAFRKRVGNSRRSSPNCSA